jgi:pimeloyl-ACP methyl ester carboxylesterase
MKKRIIYKGTEMVYSDRGEGTCLVLLHGYLESGEIWDSFADRFPKGYRLIIPDLPGHGRSGIWGEMHRMEDLAGAVKAIMEVEGMEKIFLAGHSMGGYAVMAFAELFPERLLGYSLFHSTCFADNAEKRENRDREISLVHCGKKRQIVLVNIPKAFSTDNVDLMPEEVERARRIALENSDQGIIALLHGMKARPDRSVVLKDPSLPLLLIGGMKDNYIPTEVFEKLVEMAPHAQVLRLKESGHMGFIEEPGKAVAAFMEILDGLT